MVKLASNNKLTFKNQMAKLKQAFYDIRKKIYNWSTHFGYKYNLKIYDDEFFLDNRPRKTSHHKFSGYIYNQNALTNY